MNKNKKWKDVKVGDVVEYGRYSFGAEGDIKPLQWIVLGRSSQGILALSKYGIENLPYHNREEDITWEKCSLRRWLNQEFLKKAFDDKERAGLMVTEVYNDDNEEFDTPAGADTEDKVFLLSLDEFEEFCSEEGYDICEPTLWALKQGVEVAKEEGAGCDWWLRTPGSEEDFVLTVGAYGEIGDEGVPVQWNSLAVRPAIQISLKLS